MTTPPTPSAPSAPPEPIRDWAAWSAEKHEALHPEPTMRPNIHSLSECEEALAVEADAKNEARAKLHAAHARLAALALTAEERKTVEHARSMYTAKSVYHLDMEITTAELVAIVDRLTRTDGDA